MDRHLVLGIPHQHYEVIARLLHILRISVQLLISSNSRLMPQLKSMRVLQTR
jgi:hypothetical protein